jgi:flagellar basal body-associated protein FliL
LVLRPPPPGKIQPPAPEGGFPEAAGGETFAGIGRIRATTPAPQPAAVVVSITFPYNPKDRAFSEELASRIGDFRRIALEYLGSLPVEELQSLDEKEIKAEILRRYNALLRLGRIEILYFTDFMIIP